MKRKIGILLCSLLACAAFSGCGDKQNAANGTADDSQVKKPEKIVFVTQTSMKAADGLEYVCDEYKEKTGIELEVITAEGDYSIVETMLAANDQIDAVELGSAYYPKYVNQGVLWDMTNAWENSTSAVKDALENEDYVDALRIDGKLYGFPLARGNGTVTYVRKDWLDELGLAAPTNYDEFINMLRKMKEKYNINPYTGVLNTGIPCDMYLREFYQNANPDFYKKDGVYVDGMLQPEMKEALQRLRDAYKEGLIDVGFATNKTSDAEDKFENATAGVFNYWAGANNYKIQRNLSKNYRNLASEAEKKENYELQAAYTEMSEKASVMPIAPIAEADHYIERAPSAVSITTKCKNPVSVYTYLVEYMHDGGEGQFLFTRGAQGYHWEEVDGVKVPTLYNEAKNKTLEKSFYNPELSVTKFSSEYEMALDVSDPTKDQLVENSLNVLWSNPTIESVPITSDIIEEERKTLEAVREKVLNGVVLGDMTVDEGIKKYKKDASESSEKILAELNK